MPIFDENLRAWLGQSMPGMVATTDASGQPQLVRVWAHSVDALDGVLYVHVVRSSPPAFFEALATRGRAAVNLIELPSYRARTLKGACRLVDTARVDVDVDVARSLERLGRTLATVGMPPDSPERMLAYFDEPNAMAVLRLEVDAVFDQTPGSNAGARL